MHCLPLKSYFSPHKNSHNEGKNSHGMRKILTVRKRILTAGKKFSLQGKKCSRQGKSAKTTVIQQSITSLLAFAFKFVCKVFVYKVFPANGLD